MVSLREPTPNPPQQDHDFYITAGDGVAPYRFTWKIGDDDWTEKHQDNPILEIKIPENQRGETLYVEVEDGTNETDAYSDIITG